MKIFKKQSHFRIFLFAGSAVIVILAMIAPGIIIRMQRKMDNGYCSDVPSKYYSGVNSGVARNASESLSDYERVQLITGKWESDLYDIDEYEMEMTKNDAVSIAKREINDLIEKKLYPDVELMEYSSNYNWNATAHKAVDNSFHTYTAYYWEITFSKYNAAEQHKVYLLETGRAFYVCSTFDGPISKKGLITCDKYMTMRNKSHLVVDPDRISRSSIDLYNGMDTTGMDLDISTEGSNWQDGSKVFTHIQAFSSKKYIYALIPNE